MARILFAAQSVKIMDDDTTTLGAATTVGYTYLWTPASQLNSTLISNPTIIVSNAGPGIDTLQYTVTTTLNGCTTSDSTTVLVNPLPVVQATASPTTICFGNSICSKSGTPLA